MFKKINPLSSSYLQSALFPDFYILINGTTIQQLSKFKISALSPMCPFFSISITHQLADSVSSTSTISVASSPSFPFSHYKLQSSPHLTNQNFCGHFLTGLHVLYHQFSSHMAHITSNASSNISNDSHDFSNTTKYLYLMFRVLYNPSLTSPTLLLYLNLSCKHRG